MGGFCVLISYLAQNLEEGTAYKNYGIMKKFGIFMTVILAIAGCTKEERQYVNVRFVTGVESGSMVKSTATDALSDTRPTDPVTLRISGGDVDVNVQSGTNVQLLTGTYQVTGRYDLFGWDLEVGHVSIEPVYVVDDEVDVRVGTTSYQVDAEYECWALIIDTQEVNSAFGGDEELTDWAGIGRYKVLYMSGCLEEWTLTIIPEDMELYDMTEFQMGAQENGKWYMYHPGNAVTVGNFGVGLPEWTEGE